MMVELKWDKERLDTGLIVHRTAYKRFRAEISKYNRKYKVKYGMGDLNKSFIRNTVTSCKGDIEFIYNNLYERVL